MIDNLLTIPYPDKLGCYRVGDTKFYSKLEAIEHMQKTGVHLHWDFNEAVFSAYNWTQEPTESLSELYRKRAQQLRDQYDYIVLCYSGGADSDNVLHSFVDNDIRIDEVVSMINVEATGDRDSWLNEEIYKTAAPIVAELQKKQNFRYRVVDLTPMQIDFFSHTDNRFDWIYKVTMSWTPNRVSRENWAMRIPEWASLIDSGRKVCLLYGMDKPIISHVNGKFCVKFLDIIDVAATVNSRAGLQPYTDELFYWTPDLPKITIKQAHIVKRYLQGDISQRPYVSLVASDNNSVFKQYQGKTHWLSRDGISSLIYPKWQPGRVVCPKSPSPMFSERDSWFFDLQQEHPVRKVWAMGMDKLWKSLPDYWKNNPQDITRGVKLCISPNYFIE
jgi:hypothetical protein